MSIANFPRRRGRRPKLKVVGVEPRPRNRVAVSFDKLGIAFAIEFWSFEEWWKLPEHERPEEIAWLPEIGVFWVERVDEATKIEIWDECRDKREAYNFLRGLDN